MLRMETEIGERRSKSETLKNAIEVTGVAKVTKTYRRSVFAFVREKIRLPGHLQSHQRRRRQHSEATTALDGVAVVDGDLNNTERRQRHRNRIARIR